MNFYIGMGELGGMRRGFRGVSWEFGVLRVPELGIFWWLGGGFFGKYFLNF